MDPITQVNFPAVAELASRLKTVSTELLPLDQCTQRVLAADLCADRDSPACDVSAMDGFALHQADAVPQRVLSIAGISRPGAPSPPMPVPGQALQIFTGAPVPPGADLVVQREWVQENSLTQLQPPTHAPLNTNNESAAPTAPTITLGDHVYNAGINIRRQGENARAGSPILRHGTRLHAGHIAAAANFGATHLSVASRIRVTILVTGDELAALDAQVAPWQLRDSNGPTLFALLANHLWIDPLPPQRVGDSLPKLVETVNAALPQCDALILTGGVSMGDFDFVPAALQQAGVETLFHKLPIRPGKPILGGLGPQGQLVVGLPGNPVSAAVCGRRFVLPLLAHRAGLTSPHSPQPVMHVSTPNNRPLPLHWFRLVRWNSAGDLEWVPSQGSGDLVSLAASNGFVEIPANATGSGPWPYWSW